MIEAKSIHTDTQAREKSHEYHYCWNHVQDLKAELETAKDPRKTQLIYVIRALERAMEEYAVLDDQQTYEENIENWISGA